MIYALHPVKGIVGSFIVRRIIFGNKESLWEKTKEGAGIDRKTFFDYFKGKLFGYAIEIKDVVRFEKPLELIEIGISCPPQSWRYVELPKRKEVEND